MVNTTGTISAVIKSTLEFSYKLVFGAEGVLIEFLLAVNDKEEDGGFCTKGVFGWEELPQQAMHPRRTGTSLENGK